MSSGLAFLVACGLLLATQGHNETSLPDCFVPWWSSVGDGFCDDWSNYNTAACGWDGGDCCVETCVPFYDWGGCSGYFHCRDPKFVGNRTIVLPVGCNVTDPEYLGDGYCNNHGNYNTEACGWDGGDCCNQTCVQKYWWGGCGGFWCLDPQYQVNITYPTPTPSPLPQGCNAPLPHYIGDGFCDDDGDYNTAECNWDGGDCCNQTCVSASFYCNITNPSSCRDPRYSNMTHGDDGNGYPSTCNSTNNSTNPDSYGNGFCDGSLNTEECNWDGGDCCYASCQYHGWYSCSYGFDCKDPAHKDDPNPFVVPASCNVTYPEFVGDGICNVGYHNYNILECNWDGGDCCADTCEIRHPWGGCTWFACRRDEPPVPSECHAPYPQAIGNGQCDDWSMYNTAECNWDGGDCCVETCEVFYSWGGCESHFKCRNPKYAGNSTFVPPAVCNATELEYLGDGYCDYYGPYNTEDCGWDGGDCCSETCVRKYWWGGCTHFLCLDPLYSNGGSPSPTPVPSVCNVSKPHYIGDGYCDDFVGSPYNTPECNWDGGDCCNESCVPRAYGCNINYNCQNPLYANSTYIPEATPFPSNCSVYDPSRVGDGYCDDWAEGYNTEQCNWDGGDCCYETCNFSGWWSCNSGFNCQDPKYRDIVHEVPPGCNVSEPLLVGNGICNSFGNYNTEACGWDGGDCCNDTCTRKFSWGGCGWFDCLSNSTRPTPTPTPEPNVGCTNDDNQLRCDMLATSGHCNLALEKPQPNKDPLIVQDVCPISCGCCDNAEGVCTCDNNRIVSQKLGTIGIHSCDELLSISWLSCHNSLYGALLRSLCPCGCERREYV